MRPAERNQRGGGESIGFLLAFILGAVELLDEEIPSPMPEHMAEFMKQGEPEDVRPLAPETELDDRLVWGHPARRPVRQPRTPPTSASRGTQTSQARPG